MNCRPLRAVLVATIAAGCSAEASYQPVLRPAACSPSSDPELSCFFLDVPERRADPGSRTISLYVQRLPAQDEAGPAAAPMLILNGGPGGSSGISEMMAALASHGDVVAFSQRGTLRSEPELFCGEGVEAQIRNLGLGTNDPEAIEVSVEAARACRERLIARDIDLGAYTTSASVGDIEDLRVVLEVEQWNLLGLSYGTRLALEVMRRHPRSVRSAVLAGAVPPQADVYGETAGNAGRALDRLLELCADDPQCPLAEPHATFLELVEGLDRQPLDFESVFEDGRVVPFRLDGGKIVRHLFFWLYETDLIPQVPAFLSELNESPTASFAFVEVSQATDLSVGLYRSVECAEEVPFIDRDRFGDPPAHLRGLHWASAVAECEAWDVEAAPALINQPVTSEAPTLILAGELDPVTPPHWSHAIAETLPGAQVVELPHAGHDAVFLPCGRDLLVQFLREPTAPVDRECVEAAEPLDWRR